MTMRHVHTSDCAVGRPCPDDLDAPKRYLDLAETVDNTRETMRAFVAGLVEDGFTDQQARAIVAGMFASFAKPKDTES